MDAIVKDCVGWGWECAHGSPGQLDPVGVIKFEQVVIHKEGESMEDGRNISASSVGSIGWVC